MNIKNIVPITIVYAFLVSAMNLQAFWSKFGINIYAHLSVEEVVIRAVPHFFLGVGAFFAVTLPDVFFSYIYSIGNGDSKPESKSEFEGIAKSIEKTDAKKLKKSGSFFMISGAVISLIIGIAIHATQDTNAYIIFYSLAIFFFLFAFLFYFEGFELIEKKCGISGGVANIFLVIIFTSVSFNLVKAFNIYEGLSYKKAWVEFADQKKEYSGAYVGETPRTLFLYDLQKDQILQIPKSEIKLFRKASDTTRPTPTPNS